MNKFLVMGLIIIPVIAFAGCMKADKSAQTNKVTEVIEKPEKLPEAVIKIKGYGEIRAELYPHKAPNTVNNFIELAESDFYDGLKIHRLIKDFMAQAGCPKGNGTGDAGYSIVGEFAKNGFEINDIKHTKGVLSMARSNGYDTGGSQFFIMTSEAKHLDNNYAAFGKVIDGMEEVDKINVAKVSGESPVEEMIIEDIVIEMNGNPVVEAEKIK